MTSDENNSKRFISCRTRGFATSYDQRLAKIDFFKNCSQQFLQVLVWDLKEQTFQPGEILIQEGDIGNCMYLLNIGVVDVTVADKHVATLYDGSFFGEIAVVTSDAVAAKRTASITAKTVCACWCIDRTALLKAMSAYPKDRAVISKWADERLQDLVSRGLMPPKITDRLWLRQQFQQKSINPKTENVVAQAKNKFLKALRKSSEAPEEGSTETDVHIAQENASADCSFLKATGKKAGDVSQELEPTPTGKYSCTLPRCIAHDSVTIDGSSPDTMQSEPTDTGCHMQGEDGLGWTMRSEPLRAKDMIKIIYPKRGRKSRMKASTPRGFVLPPVVSPVKSSSSWSFCETAEVSKARTSAHNFLAKRGALG